MKQGSSFLFSVIALAPAMHAGVLVSTSLSLTNFNISANSGSLQFISDEGCAVAVCATAYATAADTLGDLDQDYDDNTVSDPASASALVALASASADGSGTLLTADSASGVDIPSLNAAVLPTSTDGNATLYGDFEFTDTTGMANPITVTLAAMLNASQDLSTVPGGISADSAVTFQLYLFDTDANGVYLGNSPLLYYYNPLSIGSNSMAMAEATPSLSDSASLLTNTEYSFFLEVDAESDGYDSTTPEPGSLFLAAAGLALVLARRRLA